MSGGRHKKEIKRRTKTGCLTCRKRRIKVRRKKLSQRLVLCDLLKSLFELRGVVRVKDFTETSSLRSVK